MTDSNTWRPHVTVAAICESEQKFLLVCELVDGREVYNQPAGHLDPDETIEQAVIRETLEETAYDFTPLKLTGVYRYVPNLATAGKTYIRFAFSGTIGKHYDQPLDDGILSAKWMTLDEIKQSQHKHRSPMVLQCILDYIQKPAYSLQLFSTDFL